MESVETENVWRTHSMRYPGHAWTLKRTVDGERSWTDVHWGEHLDSSPIQVGSFDTPEEAWFAIDVLESYDEDRPLMPVFENVDLENGILTGPLSGREDVTVVFDEREVIFGFGTKGVSVRLKVDGSMGRDVLVAKLTFPEGSNLRDDLGSPGPASAMALYAVMSKRENAGLGMHRAIGHSDVPDEIHARSSLYDVPRGSAFPASKSVRKTSNASLVLYCFMRTDLASMNPGKGHAQAMHAQRHADFSILEGTHFGEDARADYKIWCGTTKQGFGTALVLDGRNGLSIASLVDALLHAGFPAGVVHDESYPIVDGDAVHLISLDTCGWAFGDREALNAYVGHMALCP